ncbi:MAG: NADAR family protein [Proteobacteria bacterium]|nr:MAG: NADAR family protein [Pseudomonadota bacterium]
MMKSFAKPFSLSIVLVLGLAGGMMGCSHVNPRDRYPAHWWKTYSPEGKPAWEVLPSEAKPGEAKPGEVILSKRNELGVLSNFAYSPFTFRGRKYLSIEGFWQMMLYPENAKDFRFKGRYPYTRSEVSDMIAFDAKSAGQAAEQQMYEMGVDWASFEGEQFPYKSMVPGRHYQLIRAAMCAKLKQNSVVSEVLQSTGDLKLLPDHHPDPASPPEWLYFKIWMELRSELNQVRGRTADLTCDSV